jgi:hypothetical protein
MSYSDSWKARINAGVVEYNWVNQPTPARARYELGHCDGGDFTLGRGEGYPNKPVDGGDFSTGVSVINPNPINCDGGDFSA